MWLKNAWGLCDLMFYFLLENATQGVPISFLLPGTSKIEHELQIEIELSNPRLKNGPQTTTPIEGVQCGNGSDQWIARNAANGLILPSLRCLDDVACTENNHKCNLTQYFDLDLFSVVRRPSPPLSKSPDSFEIPKITNSTRHRHISAVCLTKPHFRLR